VLEPVETSCVVGEGVLILVRLEEVLCPTLLVVVGGVEDGVLVEEV
jgi:hypothetical protein